MTFGPPASKPFLTETRRQTETESGETMDQQRAVFLDRDGVLNKSLGRRPPNSPAELEMLPGAAAAVKRLNDAGFKVFVVTNQGGVALGYMTREQLDAVHQKLREEVAREGGIIHDIAACTHRPWARCSCRKPQPGLLLQLARKHKIDLAQSFMVGDREVDIQAGKAAGAVTILVGQEEEETSADFTAPDLAAAAELILEQKGQQPPGPADKS